jgi:hypothetical protein
VTSEIQQKMIERMNQWLVSLDPEDAEKVLKGLAKVQLKFSQMTKEIN